MRVRHVRKLLFLFTIRRADASTQAFTQENMNAGRTQLHSNLLPQALNLITNAVQTIHRRPRLRNAKLQRKAAISGRLAAPRLRFWGPGPE